MLCVKPAGCYLFVLLGLRIVRPLPAGREKADCNSSPYTNGRPYGRCPVAAL